MAPEWIAELVKYPPENSQNGLGSHVSVVSQLDVVLLCGRKHRFTNIESLQRLIQWSKNWPLDMENLNDVSWMYLPEIPFGPRLWQVPSIVQTEYKIMPVDFSSVHRNTDMLTSHLERILKVWHTVGSHSLETLYYLNTWICFISLLAIVWRTYRHLYTITKSN